MPSLRKVQQNHFKKIPIFIPILTGGYSKYQKWLTLALIFPQFPTAMIVLSPIFTGAGNVPLLCTDSYNDNSTISCGSALNCTHDSKNFEFVSIVQEVCVEDFLGSQVIIMNLLL